MYLLLLLVLLLFYAPPPPDCVRDYPGEPVPERYNQESKTNLDLLEQETMSGSGISWAICKSAPRPRQTTMPTSHHSVFYRPDALPATQPSNNKTERTWTIPHNHICNKIILNYSKCMHYMVTVEYAVDLLRHVALI